VPFHAMVIVTANNAALRADLLRRVLPIRILVDTGTPEDRYFDFDPYLEAKRDRLQILASGLTVLRAWWNVRETEEGRRIRKKTLGSFEHWADLVAGAVDWLTGTNPITLIEERKAEDQGRAEERQVIDALWKLFQTSEWTAKEAVGRPAPAYQSEDNPIPATGLDPDIWRGVLDFKGERPTPKEVGKWLGQQKDKVFGDLRLSRRLDNHKIAQWQVKNPVSPVSTGIISPKTREMSLHHSGCTMTSGGVAGRTKPDDTGDTGFPPLAIPSAAKKGLF
jgi:hypothetical protein